MPAPRRPGGIDASMLSSPHRVTSPEHAQYHGCSRRQTTTEGQRARRRSYKRRCNGREREERENRALQQQQQQRKKQTRPNRRSCKRERRSYKGNANNNNNNSNSLRNQKKSPRDNHFRERERHHLPEPGKLVPRQPIGRPAELPQQPQQPRQPRVVDEVTSESRPTSIRDIMVKKARDERKTEMRARKEKRKRANLMDGGGGASLEDGGSQPTKTGTTTLVHFEEDAPIANEEQRETEETPNAENGRRTRLRNFITGRGYRETKYTCCTVGQNTESEDDWRIDALETRTQKVLASCKQCLDLDERASLRAAATSAKCSHT